jgi:hypothetical protein
MYVYTYIGSQFRLPLGPSMTCDFCFKTDMNAKISKDNSRTLKLQLGEYAYIFMYIFMYICMYMRMHISIY